MVKKTKKKKKKLHKKKAADKDGDDKARADRTRQEYLKRIERMRQVYGLGQAKTQTQTAPQEAWQAPSDAHVLTQVPGQQPLASVSEKMELVRALVTTDV